MLAYSPADKKNSEYYVLLIKLPLLILTQTGFITAQWQLPAGIVLLIGVNMFLVAPTGAGKTLPFVIPCFYNALAVVFIILPLNLLEDSEVRLVH
jgi:hypothetical protein